MKCSTIVVLGSATVGALISAHLADAVLMRAQPSNPSRQYVEDGDRSYDASFLVRAASRLIELNGLTSSFVQQDNSTSDESQFINLNNSLVKGAFEALNRVNNATAADGVLFPNKLIDAKFLDVAEKKHNYFQFSVLGKT